MITLEKSPIPPADRLPLKVLARILVFRTLERTLVTATHVCRHWRSAILSVPDLWTNIPCRDPHLSRTFERRPNRHPRYLTVFQSPDPRHPESSYREDAVATSHSIKSGCPFGRPPASRPCLVPRIPRAIWIHFRCSPNQPSRRFPRP